MSTKNLLTQSVHFAQKDVFPTVKTAISQLEKASAVPEDLRSEKENKLVLIRDYINKNIPLINLKTAISAGGIFKKSGLPRLCVAHYLRSINEDKADVLVRDDGSVLFNDDYFESEKKVYLPAGTLPTKPGILGFLSYPVEACDVVPIVPYELRQKKSEGVYVLFEANWTKIRIAVDPYLLKHIAGHIYAILGTWDVTDSELEAYNAASNLGL